jgi:hypothetical protein
LAGFACVIENYFPQNSDILSGVLSTMPKARMPKDKYRYKNSAKGLREISEKNYINNN